MRFIIVTLLSAIMMSCTTRNPQQTFDLQGHRGARGLAPENTIPGFLKALEHNVDTIELDVVVTADRKILVSHEPWFHHNYSTKPDGSPVTEEEQMELNIFEMTYEETRQFDVGKRSHPSFPGQSTQSARKPLLTEGIRTVENYANEHDVAPVMYNIEMKSDPDLYGEFYPQPEEFAMLLNDVLTELAVEFDLLDRIVVQSFDPAALIEFRNIKPDISLAMLVSNNQSMQSYIDTLGFTPEIWSPNYQLVTQEMVTEAHNRGMKVIPWTVNTVEEMRELLDLGVDGIITDYPDSASAL